MESNNSNSDSLKKYSIFSTSESTEQNITNQNDSLNNNLSQQQVLTIDDIAKQVMQKVDMQLYEKLGDKGINVIKQREVIETQSQEKKMLEEQLKQSLTSQEELKKQLNELQEKISNIDGFNDLTGIKTQLQNIEKFQIQQKLKPIIEFMEAQGVSKQDIQPVLEHIQKNYKPDFYVNPDQSIVEFVLWKEKQLTTMNQQNYAIPKGSYNNNYSSHSEQMQQQILQQQLVSKEEEIKKRAEERRRKAQIA